MKVPLYTISYTISNYDPRCRIFHSINLRNIIFSTLENFTYIKNNGFEYLKFINLLYL